jgi:putative transposase
VIVLLWLSYLALTDVFAFVRLLPMSDVDKDVEILALRQQLTRPAPKVQIRQTDADAPLAVALRRIRAWLTPATLL